MAKGNGAVAPKKEPVDVKAKVSRLITAWQSSNSRDEVAEKLSLTKRTIANSIQALRKQGIPLKKMSHPKRGGFGTCLVDNHKEFVQLAKDKAPAPVVASN